MPRSYDATGMVAGFRSGRQMVTAGPLMAPLAKIGKSSLRKTRDSGLKECMIIDITPYEGIILLLFPHSDVFKKLLSYQ
jgi:hypothetical protein